MSSVSADNLASSFPVDNLYFFLLLDCSITSSIELDNEVKVDILGLFKIFENEPFFFPLGIMLAVGLLFMFFSAYWLISIVWMLSHLPNLPIPYYICRVGYLYVICIVLNVTMGPSYLYFSNDTPNIHLIWWYTIMIWLCLKFLIGNISFCVIYIMPNVISWYLLDKKVETGFLRSCS